MVLHCSRTLWWFDYGIDMEQKNQEPYFPDQIYCSYRGSMVPLGVLGRREGGGQRLVSHCSRTMWWFDNGIDAQQQKD